MINQIKQLLENFGDFCLFIGRTLKACVCGSWDRFELLRILYLVGVCSLPIILATALFAGAIVATQVGSYVTKYRAYEVVGWGFGFGTFRELGPLLIGLMFSGRVGAHHAAELGTMKVTEQIDALRALAIDPIEYLVVPRLVAMVVMMTLLNIIGDFCALVGGMVTSYVLVGVDPYVFWNSFCEYVKLGDFLNGCAKAGCFGVCIAFVSCYMGMSVQGGAPAVGRAVNNSVVFSAVGIFAMDYGVTWLWN